jgi:perosamine synthetase
MNVKYFRAKPYIPDSDKDWILEKHKDILDTRGLIQGKYVSQFEEEVRKYVGTKHAIAVSSCGVGLEITLRASGIIGKKFIVPTQTYPASVSCIIRSGNIPVIVDVDERTQCLSLDIIKKNMDSDVAGVVHVHMAGLITPEMDDIKVYCKDNGLFLLTDDAHSFGAQFYNVYKDNVMSAGDIGNAGVFSFYPSKIITTAEGGMITTNDDDLADKLRILRNHGVVGNEVLVDGLDYGVRCEIPSSNYRMTEFNAVLGLSQIKHIDEWIKRRNEISDLYRKKLEDVEWLELPLYDETIKQTWWQYIVKLDSTIDRTEFLKRLLDKGVQTGNAYWPACNQQEVFKSYVSEFGCPVADEFLERHFSLPMYIELSDENVEEICNIVKSCK